MADDTLEFDLTGIPDAAPDLGLNLEGIEDEDPDRPPATAGRVVGRFWETLRTTPSQMATTARSYMEQNLSPEDYATLDETWGILSAVEQTLVNNRMYEIMHDQGLELEPARKQAIKEHWARTKAEGIEAMQQWEQAPAFAPSEKYKGVSSGFAEDVAGGVAFSLTTIPLHFYPPAMIGAIYARIHGMKVQELEAAGIDKTRAFQAAQASAAAQTPLEYAGNLLQLRAIMGGGQGWIKHLKDLALAGLGEGFEEFIQQYPDEFATMWAMNPDDTPQQFYDRVREELPSIHKRALYAAAVGGAAGIILPGAGKVGRAGLEKIAYPETDVGREEMEREQVRERILRGAPEEEGAPGLDITREEFIDQVRTEGSEIQYTKQMDLEEGSVEVTKEAGSALNDVERDQRVYEDLLKCLRTATG